jgi:CRP-like cAMP-binding protein
MTGVAVVLGNDHNANEVFIQVAGEGQCIRTPALRKAIEKSTTLHGVLLRYVHAYLEQTSRTAVANGRSKIEERLARWLLMARDRMDGDEMALTHEFLAMMLGVRRAGVTIAIQELERIGVISRSRGQIVMVDRKALERLSHGTYVPADYH